MTPEKSLDTPMSRGYYTSCRRGNPRRLHPEGTVVMNSVAVDILALRAALPTLSGRDADFATSLLDAYDTRGLSDKQKLWVGRLAQPQAPAPTASVGDFSGVVALFDAAKAHLKFPK